MKKIITQVAVALLFFALYKFLASRIGFEDTMLLLIATLLSFVVSLGFYIKGSYEEK